MIFNSESDKTINEIRSALARGETIQVRTVPDEPAAYELGFSEVVRIVMEGWKKILITTIVFILIGLICSVISYIIPDKVTKTNSDLFITKVNTDDNYPQIFESARESYINMNTYLDALVSNLQSYNDSGLDIEVINNLKLENNKNYVNNFLYAENIYNTYTPIKGKDNDRKLIELKNRQIYLQNETKALRSELAYLESIASSSSIEKGAAVDSVIAQGVVKARDIALLAAEYDKNNLLIAELSGNATNPEKVVQTEKMVNLINDGASVNDVLVQKINNYVSDYTAKHNVNIKVKEVRDTQTASAFTYTVTVEKNNQEMTPGQYVTAIMTVCIVIGFGLGCLLVLWLYLRNKSRNQCMEIK